MQLSFKSFQPLLLSSSSLERGSILLNLFRTTYTSPSLSPIPSFSKKPSPQLPTRVFVFSKIIYNHLLNQISCPCHMLHLFSKWLSLGLDEYNMTYTIKRHQQGLKLKSSLPRVVHTHTHTHERTGMPANAHMSPVGSYSASCGLPWVPLRCPCATPVWCTGATSAIVSRGSHVFLSHVAVAMWPTNKKPIFLCYKLKFKLKQSRGSCHKLKLELK